MISKSNLDESLTKEEEEKLMIYNYKQAVSPRTFSNYILHQRRPFKCHNKRINNQELKRIIAIRKDKLPNPYKPPNEFKFRKLKAPIGKPNFKINSKLQTINKAEFYKGIDLRSKCEIEMEEKKLEKERLKILRAKMPKAPFLSKFKQCGIERDFVS